MGINVSKLFGSNVIAGTRGNVPAQRVVSNPIQNKGLYTSINGLDKTYGQSPVVEDYANAGKYFGDPVLKHLAYC